MRDLNCNAEVNVDGRFEYLVGGWQYENTCRTPVMHLRMWISTVINTTELDKVCDAWGRKPIEFGDRCFEV